MHRRDLRAAAVGALGAVIAMTLMAQAGLTLSDQGVRFPDGTLQTTAAPADPRRSYYLAGGNFYTGEEAPTACASGYHMASLWEILDVSNLRYAVEHPDAYTQADSGMGPPSEVDGWIRTGNLAWDARDSADPFTDAGRVNCKAYDDPSAEFGTAAQLKACWQFDQLCDSLYGSAVAPWWETRGLGCGNGIFVWCVQD